MIKLLDLRLTPQLQQESEEEEKERWETCLSSSSSFLDCALWWWMILHDLTVSSRWQWQRSLCDHCATTFGEIEKFIIREIEKFIIRQPPKGEKDDYDSENSWISDGLPRSSRRRRRGDGRWNIYKTTTKPERTDAFLRPSLLREVFPIPFEVVMHMLNETV